jgi:HEPN domain-containing protein
MDKQTKHEVQQWLFKADHDLRSALRLMTPDNEDALLDTAVYHCQQAAEKAFKAYLTANEIPFPKIHLLLPLLALCNDIDASFSQLADACRTPNSICN